MIDRTVSRSCLVRLGLSLVVLAAASVLTACRVPDNTLVAGTTPAATGPASVGGLAMDDPHSPVAAPGTCHMSSDHGQPLPDPHCTPGAVNPAVTQASVSSTICRSGYTATIRPPASVTDRLKR